MIIKYTGPFGDYSGYGEASRHHIAALDAAGVTVIGDLVSYSSENSDYGTLGPLMQKVKDNTGIYKTQMLHSTPDEFTRLVEPGKYHIGFCYWETDKIPVSFAEGLSSVDEIWTGSQANFEAIRKGGVTKPIKIFPQAIETNRDWPSPYEIPGFDGYLFYSIFEWTDRKNPEVLISAFLEEFNDKENVGLLLKTYYRNFSFTNKKMIRNRVQMVKDASKGGDIPPIFLYLDLMDRQQVMRIHSTGDCYVSTHRGEGWGIPLVEASLAGKPIISTAYGGVNEYFDETNARLLPFKMIQLKGMLQNTRFYSEDQNWAEIAVKNIRKAMRDVYDSRKKDNKARLAQQFVKERFNLKRVGSEMLDRLTEIEAGL